MIITNTSVHLKDLISIAKRDRSIGFIPTMGALHDGHLSLVRAAKEKCDFVIVSIFVNPTQFDNPNDLANYPRDIDVDIKKLSDSGVDLLFIPSEQEIYPMPDRRIFDFGSMDKVMEGIHRPGHFNGVAQVVDRLFRLVQPTVAFFGEKDFQQLAIVRALVEKRNLQVKIMSGPTVREHDGLAMSSRNRLLTNIQRSQAPVIYKTLLEAAEKMDTLEVAALKKWVHNTINEGKILETQYVEIVDARTLQPIKKWSDAGSVQLCVAVFAKPVRLIDNIRLK